jgi:hypothetical protein
MVVPGYGAVRWVVAAVAVVAVGVPLLILVMLLVVIVMSELMVTAHRQRTMHRSKELLVYLIEKLAGYAISVGRCHTSDKCQLSRPDELPEGRS